MGSRDQWHKQIAAPLTQTAGWSMIDPRLVFLERAAARLALLEAGAMNLEEAFDGLMPAVLQIADCRCYREIIESFDRCRPASKHRRAA
jgi:hypothetical protein